jgi:transcription initiation factor TFIID subunit 7
MDEDSDLIVVDDVEALAFTEQTSAVNGGVRTESFYSPSTSSRPVRASALASTSRLRSTPGMEASDRTTRSAAARLKPQPKLKIKLSEKAAAQAPGMSFLGPYDRELDSDGDEDLAFEEQFILRMPPGEDCERLKKMAASRDVTGDVWLKFKGKCFVMDSSNCVIYEPFRFKESRFSYRKFFILFQAR